MHVSSTLMCLRTQIQPTHPHTRTHSYKKQNTCYWKILLIIDFSEKQQLS